MKLAKYFFVACLYLLTLGRCTPSVTPSTPIPVIPTVTPSPTQPATPTDLAEPVTITWFVGLGAGSDASAIIEQRKLVTEFNQRQNRIHLELQVVSNNVAFAHFQNRLQTNEMPDLVGPLGIRARDRFAGQWLDLAPLIEQQQYDLSDFSPSLLKQYNLPGEGQVGLPLAVFPSFIMVNTELFKTAGIPLPPQEYGVPYVDENGVEHEWNMETFRLVAMKLTLDKNGHNALSPDFDPTQITQFGFSNNWSDDRGRLSFFGAGSFVDENNQPTFPAHWQEALHWYHQAMWQDYFYPSNKTAKGNLNSLFDLNRLAMRVVHLWFLNCCFSGYNGQWNMIVNPSYQGQITAIINVDSFAILKNSPHPAEAFEVMTYLLGEKAETLARIYSGMPARASLQPLYFDKLINDYKTQDINWEVLIENIRYPDNPNFETGFPMQEQVQQRFGLLWSLVTTKSDLDLETEIKNFEQDLEDIYQEQE